MFYDSFMQEQSVSIYRHQLTFFTVEPAIVPVYFSPKRGDGSQIDSSC